jgi:hypothetical protein
MTTNKFKIVVPNPYEGLTREQVIDTMRQLAANETRNQILMGLLYNYLLDSNLLKDTEYKRPLDFICDNVQEVSRTALVVYGAVAHAFTQEVSNRYGISRLRLLLTYKQQANIQVNHEEPGNTFILVPQEEGAAKPKLFADCTVEDMRKALQHLRQSATTPAPAEHRALVDQYRAAVINRFPKGSPVRVQLRFHKNEVVVDFRSIPVLQVNKLTEALLEQLTPEPELPEVEVEVVEPAQQAQ